MINEKNIYSGKMFEVEFYPVYADGRRMPSRAPKVRPSKKEQKALNNKNARKKLTRLVNTNFGRGDYAVHGTYRDSEMPSTEDEARRDIVNYIRRIKRLRKKLGLPELKYIYVIEAKVSKKTGVLRWHWHMIMSGGIDRDTIEEMWPHGDHVNCDRLQPNEKGCEALAKYMVKEPMGSKRWAQSKNLKKPTIKTKSGKFTKRGMATIAHRRIDDKDYWENRYKGYRFLEANAAYNEINGHWYVSVTMYKKEGRQKNEQTL